MTLKEFSVKYDVPYHIVYEASYKVPSISTMRKDREYPERELLNEVKRVVKSRIRRHKALAERQMEIFDKLRGISP